MKSSVKKTQETPMKGVACNKAELRNAAIVCIIVSNVHVHAVSANASADTRHGQSNTDTDNRTQTIGHRQSDSHSPLLVLTRYVTWNVRHIVRMSHSLICIGESCVYVLTADELRNKSALNQWGDCV